jgi:hypothetical protein
MVPQRDFMTSWWILIPPIVQTSKQSNQILLPSQ